MGLRGFFRLPGLDKRTRGPQKESCLLVPRSNVRGIPEIMFRKILTFMWSLGALASSIKERTTQREEKMQNSSRFCLRQCVF